MNPIDGWKSLMRENHGVEFADLVEIELFPLEGVTASSFEAFLIKSRVHLFLKLHILDRFWGAQWVPAFENYTTWKAVDYDKDIWEPLKEYGPTILLQEVSTEDLFEEYLERTSVSAIDCEFKVQQKGEYESVHGHVDLTEGEIRPEYPENFLMMDGKVVMAELSVHVAPELAEETLGIIAHHREKFAAFVEEYKDSFVPHTVYVDWLLTWFPGKVKVRSIGSESV